MWPNDERPPIVWVILPPILLVLALAIFCAVSR